MTTLVPLPNAAHPYYRDLKPQIHALGTNRQPEIKVMHPQSGHVELLKLQGVSVGFRWQVWMDTEGRMCSAAETGLLVHQELQPGDYRPPVFPDSDRHITLGRQA